MVFADCNFHPQVFVFTNSHTSWFHILLLPQGKFRISTSWLFFPHGSTSSQVDGQPCSSLTCSSDFVLFFEAFAVNICNMLLNHRIRKRGPKCSQRSILLGICPLNSTETDSLRHSMEFPLVQQVVAVLFRIGLSMFASRHILG